MTRVVGAKCRHAAETAVIRFDGDTMQARVLCRKCGATWFARLLPAVSPVILGVDP